MSDFNNIQTESLVTVEVCILTEQQQDELQHSFFEHFSFNYLSRSYLVLMMPCLSHHACICCSVILETVSV